MKASANNRIPLDKRRTKRLSELHWPGLFTRHNNKPDVQMPRFTWIHNNSETPSMDRGQHQPDIHLRAQLMTPQLSVLFHRYRITNSTLLEPCTLMFVLLGNCFYQTHQIILVSHQEINSTTKPHQHNPRTLWGWIRRTANSSQALATQWLHKTLFVF